MKNGFGKSDGYALFVTIFMILTMSIIISQILNVADHSLKDAKNTQNFTQLELLTKDIIAILKNSKELNKVKDAEDFDNTLNLISNISIPLNDDKEVNIDIASGSTKININSIKNWGTSQQNKFLTYLQTKGVLMPEYFYHLLKDLLDKKSNFTDIKRDIPSIDIGSIIDYREFETIIKYYIENTKDYSILNVPWKKIITFDGDKLNVNYISCEEWRMLLGGDINNETINEICTGKRIIKKLNELGLDDATISLLKKFGLSADDRVIRVSIKLSSKQKEDIISTFLYDIQSKKVFNGSMVF